MSVCICVHGLQERAATAEQARERLHQLVMDLEVVSSACMRDSLEMMHERTHTHAHACTHMRERAHVLLEHAAASSSRDLVCSMLANGIGREEEEQEEEEEEEESIRNWGR